MPNLLSRVVTAVALATIAAPAIAHHSVSGQFDARDSALYTVTGTLKKVDWINPHIYFAVDVKDKAGKVVTHNFENFPPSFWRRQGVNKAAFKVGDAITVDAYPARDGTKTLGFAKVIHLSDGRTIATMTAESAATAR